MSWALTLAHAFQVLEGASLPRGSLENLLLLGILVSVGIGCCCCGLAWGLILGQVAPRGWTALIAKLVLKALQAAEAEEANQPFRGRAAARLAAYRN